MADVKSILEDLSFLKKELNNAVKELRTIADHQITNGKTKIMSMEIFFACFQHIHSNHSVLIIVISALILTNVQTDVFSGDSQHSATDKNKVT